MEQNIEEWANEFVTAYYSSVVYSKRDVSKFYDPDNAIIYRESLKEKPGVKISEAADILVPRIEKGDKLMITQYNTVPTQKGFNLSVFGRTIANEKTNHFAQFFTIKFYENRAAIISDSLMNINIDEAISNELVEIPRPSHAKQNASHQQNSSPKTEVQQQQANVDNNSSNNKENGNTNPPPAQQKSKNTKSKKPKNNKFYFTPDS